MDRVCYNPRLTVVAHGITSTIGIYTTLRTLGYEGLTVLLLRRGAGASAPSRTFAELRVGVYRCTGTVVLPLLPLMVPLHP